ncbi:MAG TPA: hypothetical protein VGQ49_22880 [Bryobacteraceae bacterium]|jgi:uncharacterized protein YuzE|nr:hypothetical protein [Bryobacteraceae bacterium]
MTLSYDKLADVLYVTFETLPAGSYIYVENDTGDILRLDRSSKRVVGVTIPAFAQRAARGSIVIPEIGSVPFNQLVDDLLHA